MAFHFSRAVPLFARAARSIPRSGLGCKFQGPIFNAAQIRLLSNETRAAIDKAIASSPVVLFMKGTPEMPQCGYSRATVKILGIQGVDPKKFAAFNVLDDTELKEGIKEYSKWPTIPQLYINKEFIGGCDILVSMHQNGELAELLEKEGVLAPEEESEPTTPTSS
ncbi:glutaredoxin [Kalaharituber pfeilii]|nr:glutaredoxin [Kalaharituber pfeilii]